MTSRLTTLRTITQYSLARLRVLCTTHTLWSTLLVSSLLVLAVIGTSAAWRVRTSGEEPPVDETTFSVSPLAELVPQTATALPPHGATTAPSAPPTTLSTATTTGAFTQSDEVRNPMTTSMNGEDRAQPAFSQPVSATPHDVVRRGHERMRAERRAASVRMARESDIPASHFRHAPHTPAPAVPRVQVVSVSSTAVLIQQDGRRQIIRRGARLNGWTLARLAPTGVTLRHGQHQALLPLSFGARFNRR